MGGGVPSAGVQGPLHGAPRELAAGQTPGLGDKAMATLLCHTQTAAPGAAAGWPRRVPAECSLVHFVSPAQPPCEGGGLVTHFTDVQPEAGTGHAAGRSADPGRRVRAHAKTCGRWRLFLHQPPRRVRTGWSDQV